MNGKSNQTMRMNKPAVVRHYIKTRIAVTKCLQKHFKQLCNNCPEYFNCKLHAKYCDAWMKLQEIVKKK